MLPKLELAPIRMYLRMLAKTFRPSTHALLQHQQALLQQDGVGRLLGDIDGRVHRDADVGGPEGRGVVDAVAQEPDDVARACSALMTRCLWAGDSRANRVVSVGGLRQFRVGHAFDLAAQQHLVRASMPTSRQILRLTSSLSPVSTLTATPVPAERGDRRAGAVLGRVEEGDVAAQDQVRLVVLRVGRLRRPGPCTPGPATRKPSALSASYSSLAGRRDELVIEQAGLAVQLEAGAAP